MAATETKVFKLSLLDDNGASRTISIGDVNDTISSQTLGDVSDAFSTVGYTIINGQYVTTSKSDKIEP